jgi:hypothetical protein
MTFQSAVKDLAPLLQVLENPTALKLVMLVPAGRTKVVDPFG